MNNNYTFGSKLYTNLELLRPIQWIPNMLSIQIFEWRSKFKQEQICYLGFHRNLALHDHKAEIRDIDHLIFGQLFVSIASIVTINYHTWFRGECFIAVTCWAGLI